MLGLWYAQTLLCPPFQCEAQVLVEEGLWKCWQGRCRASLLMQACSLPPQVWKALRVPAAVAEHSDDPHHATDAEALH